MEKPDCGFALFQITRCCPNVYNWGVTSVDLAGKARNNAIYTPLENVEDGLAWRSGTSFSAPLVTGTAALIKSIKPNATTAQIREAILTGVDTNTNYASLYATSGKLNAQKAITYFTIYGDVNNDGLINDDDVTLIREQIMTGNTLTGKNLIAANADRYGDITVSDVVAVRAHIADSSKIDQSE